MSQISKILAAWYKSEDLIWSMLGNDLAAETWELIDKVQFQIEGPKGELIGVSPEPVRHKTSKALSDKAKKSGDVRETVAVVSVPKGMKKKYAAEIEKRMKAKGFNSFEILKAWREPQTHKEPMRDPDQSPIDKMIEDTLSERFPKKKVVKSSFIVTNSET